MHQTIIILVIFVMCQWNIPVLVKYSLVMVTDFPLILGLYEYLVRRNNILRFLFGLKPQQNQLVASLGQPKAV